MYLPRGLDTVVVPGVRILLHRIGRGEQGPIDSTVAGGAGHFDFRFPPDTTAVFLLSARYGGIEYFSTPVHTNPQRPDTAVALLVYDTSSTAPIGVEARHVVVPMPGPDGSRAVLELVVLRNSGALTRVSAGPTHPSWWAPLPGGSVGLEAVEGDISPDAVARRGDSIVVRAPIAPGEKQISFQYLIPGDRSSIDIPPFGVGAPVNLLIEEPSVIVSGDDLAVRDSQRIEGRTFRRFSGAVAEGGFIRVTLPHPRATGRWVLLGLVLLLALALAGASWRMWHAHQPVRDHTAALLDAIAVLDARYGARQGDTSPEEWDRYRQERARLKAALERSLAAGGPLP